MSLSIAAEAFQVFSSILVTFWIFDIFSLPLPVVSPFCFDVDESKQNSKHGGKKGSKFFNCKINNERHRLKAGK